MRAALAATPRAVWAVTALFAALVLAYSVLLPQYRQPDEPAHVDVVVHLQDSWELPRPLERFVGQGVAESTVLAGYARQPDTNARGNAPLLEPPALPRGERPGFDALGGDEPSALLNQMGQHPPLYYVGAATLMRATGGADTHAFDRTVLALRLLSGVLLLPVPWLAWWTARRLGAGTAAAVAAACAVLAVPRLVSLAAAVNNDSLLVLLFSVATALSARVLTGDRSLGTAVALGTVAGAALLTKGLALVLPLWLGPLYLVALWRDRDRRQVRNGLVVAALAGALGGWWYVRNLALYGTVQPAGVRLPEAIRLDEPLSGGGAVLDYLALFASRLAATGWYNHSIPDGEPEARPAVWLGLVAVAAVAALAVAGLVRSRPADRLVRAAVCAVPAVLVLGMLLVVMWEAYRLTGRPIGMQGRYLYPALVGLAVLCSLGGAALLGRHARWLPAAVLGAALVGTVASVVPLLVWHWGLGRGAGPADVVGSVLAWSPVPAPVTAVLLLLPLAAAAVTGRVVVRDARRPGRAPAGVAA